MAVPVSLSIQIIRETAALFNDLPIKCPRDGRMSDVDARVEDSDLDW
jgi:hypothetical protein